jgi:hypothetical protein
MLEAFHMIEPYCNRLMEHAAQLDKPQYVSFLHPAALELIFFSCLMTLGLILFRV